MNCPAIEQIADAVLYEGYVLYPYRASAAKNRQRWNFGGLFPRAYSEAHNGSDAWRMQTECLIEVPRQRSSNPPTVELKVRFLQVSTREAGRLISPEVEWSNEANAANAEPAYEVVNSVVVNGTTIHTWQEAIERHVCIDSLALPELVAHGVNREFSFPGSRQLEMHRGEKGDEGVVIVRRQQQIEGSVEISAERVADRLYRLRVVSRNNTPIENPTAATRDEAAMFAIQSTHTILQCHDGEFISLMDPPAEWREFAAGCKNVGAWPVLVGTEPRRDFMLASPIILYDYPQIAPESAGDLCDGLEIDEILTLRIMSLTDAEKEEMRSLDDRTRAILERTENLPPDQLAKLHGAVRGLRQVHTLG